MTGLTLLDVSQGLSHRPPGSVRHHWRLPICSAGPAAGPPGGVVVLLLRTSPPPLRSPFPHRPTHKRQQEDIRILSCYHHETTKPLLLLEHIVVNIHKKNNAGASRHAGPASPYLSPPRARASCLSSRILHLSQVSCNPGGLQFPAAQICDDQRRNDSEWK